MFKFTFTFVFFYVFVKILFMIFDFNFYVTNFFTFLLRASFLRFLNEFFFFVKNLNAVPDFITQLLYVHFFLSYCFHLFAEHTEELKL